MSFKKFETRDIVHSTIVAKPEFNFLIHDKKVYLNYESAFSGSFDNNVKHTNQGNVSLYELNINRPENSLINQFITKDTTRYAFRSISATQFDDLNQFTNGDTLTHTLPLTSSISRIYIGSGQEFDQLTFSNLIDGDQSFAAENKKYIRALKNVINTQSPLTKTGVKYGDLGASAVNLICVPSIFYGSEMQKESVELNFYITGALTSQAKDIYGNGELISTHGVHSGSQVGMVLYNQGIMLLTGALDQSTQQDNYFAMATTAKPSWLSFGTGIDLLDVSPGTYGNVVNSSYEVKFKGTNKIPTVTMLAYANTSELNYSNNPTFIDKDNQATGSVIENSFVETPGKIKNIKDSGFTGYDSRFENVTYISKIGIYDEHKNLIGIASLANPVKKSEYRDYMFKLRLDF